MAAMRGGRHGAAGDHEDHKIELFQNAMREFQKYPFNLDPKHMLEKIKFVSDFRQHFDQTKDDILLVLGQNAKGFRRKLIESKIHVEFHDAGLRDSSLDLVSLPPPAQPPVTTPSSSGSPGLERGESSASSWDSKDDTKVYSVSNSKHLDDTFGIGSLDPATTGNEPGFQPRADPVCRFMYVSESFLATSAPNARRVKITEELLLRILTYHHVSPCFLNLISSLGHDPLSNAGDHYFGGFRSLKSFSKPLFKLTALDRSGYHYQLAFEFRTVFRPSPSEAESTAQTSDNPDLWPLDQCTIYHHFDVENGKSLWMITAAEGEANKLLSEAGTGGGPPFRDVKDVRFSTNVLSGSPVDERFRASLSVLLWLADWSLSEYGHYITMLDDDLQRLTRPYVEKIGEEGPVAETGLKELNRYMEKLDEIIVALQGNLRVCNAALKFYRDELLQDRKLRSRNLAWVTDKQSRARIREDLDDFQEKMRWVCTSTQGMLRRAVLLKQVGARRENTASSPSLCFPLPCDFPNLSSNQVHRLLTNRDVTTTNDLARSSHKESTTMRVFSTITLVLLPVSVVSTIFSANIVDFQSGAGGFAGNWSGPAALWWAATTILVTALVGWAGERWRRHAIDADTTGKARRAQPRPGAAAAASRHDLAWTAQVRRVVNDARHHVRKYEYSLGGVYTRVMDVVKRARKTAVMRTRRTTEPTGSSTQHHPTQAGDGHTTPERWSREQLPSSSSSVSVRSGLSDPMPEGGGEGSGKRTVDGMAARASATEGDAQGKVIDGTEEKEK
ncbi:hypothetical protein NEMBOFW57_008156 [Staphylotrichum longicolle]|uniref:CorA-like transporter domain-containing protein n=1 Tax=Staphylotrichum longicolle TaxID=669026 RepID=A0AAD4EUL5_9PEZI|nr:hypothetical protein NEMBOFW57_008156 [Staphylotrichum longicolle]